jgi:hypothetical protein
MLARDLRVTIPHIDVASVGSRLRMASDCLPTRYELYVMASYIESGLRVEKTDAHSRDEFRTTGDGQWVHVECKHKDVPAMPPRRVRAVFDKGNHLRRELMEDKGRRAMI